MRIRRALAVVAAASLLGGVDRGDVGRQPAAFETLVATAATSSSARSPARSSRFVDARRQAARRHRRHVPDRRGAQRRRARALKTLTFLGGQVGDVRMDVPGMPAFMVGDRDVLFVQRGAPALMPIVALFHGRFRVVTGPGGAGAVRRQQRAPADPDGRRVRAAARGSSRRHGRWPCTTSSRPIRTMAAGR